MAVAGMLDSVNKDESVRCNLANSGCDGCHIIADASNGGGVQDSGHLHIRRNKCRVICGSNSASRIVVGHIDVGFARLFSPVLGRTARSRMFHRRSQNSAFRRPHNHGSDQAEGKFGPGLTNEELSVGRIKKQCHVGFGLFDHFYQCMGRGIIAALIVWHGGELV